MSLINAIATTPNVTKKASVTPRKATLSQPATVIGCGVGSSSGDHVNVTS